MSNLFFVYGSLKRGHRLHSLLSTSKFIQEDITKDNYALGDVGFPYAFPEWVVKGVLKERLLKPVKGEVYEVTDPMVVQALDHVEGEGTHYHRNLRETQSGLIVNIYEQLDVNAVFSCNQATLKEDYWVWP